jgi:hypothetical protein
MDGGQKKSRAVPSLPADAAPQGARHMFSWTTVRWKRMREKKNEMGNRNATSGRGNGTPTKSGVQRWAAVAAAAAAAVMALPRSYHASAVPE